jgi:hypothetical protein
MADKPKKAAPSWSDVKIRLAEFDRAGLLGLLQDLYAASKDNQAFLHTRFGLGDEILTPYKTTIDRWLWPDVYRSQDVSVSKAKKAIGDYKKASGRPEGLAELMVFFCERAAGFARDLGYEDEAYMDALVRMFRQALKQVAVLPEEQRVAMLDRLDRVSVVSNALGYGVADDMEALLSTIGSCPRARGRQQLLERRGRPRLRQRPS